MQRQRHSERLKYFSHIVIKSGAKKRVGKKAALPTGNNWDPTWAKERIARALGPLLVQNLLQLFGSHAPMERCVNLAQQIGFRCVTTACFARLPQLVTWCNILVI